MQITQEKFFELLTKRLRNYSKVIPATGDANMMMHMLRITSSHIQEIRNLNFKLNLFGNGFWGYGINSISIENEKHDNFDVDEIEKGNKLNKHIEYNLFWLTIFRIENEYVYFNIFCLDLCSGKFNSNNNKRYNLYNFSNAVVKTRGMKVFIDLEFTNLSEPISFQIDNYLDALGTANYYVEKFKTEHQELINKSKSGVPKQETILETPKPSIYHRVINFIYKHWFLSILALAFGFFIYITNISTGVDYWKNKINKVDVDTTNNFYAFTPVSFCFNIDDWPEKNESSIMVNVETNSNNFKLLDSIILERVNVLEKDLLYDSYQQPKIQIIDKHFSRKLLNRKENKAQIELIIKSNILFDGKTLGGFEKDKKLLFASIFFKVPFVINNQVKVQFIEVPFFIKR